MVSSWFNGQSVNPKWTPVRANHIAARSDHFYPLTEFAQPLAQAHMVKRPEGELNEGPELPLETSEHGA
jgi:hypothetical protein